MNNNLPESSRHYVELFSHALMHLRTLRSSTRLLHALRKSKQTLRTSTSLVYPLQKTKRTLRFSANLLHALRKFKWSIQTSSRLLHVCNSQNPLSEVLQASYTLFGSQNRLSEHQAPLMLSVNEKRLSKPLRCKDWLLSLKLWGSVTLCGSPNGLTKLLQASYTLLHALW